MSADIIDCYLAYQEREDSLRLDKALAEMVYEQHADLVRVMHVLRHLLADQPPLRAGFACLAVAELMLMRVPGFEERDFVRLRSFATTLAERIAEG